MQGSTAAQLQKLSHVILAAAIVEAKGIPYAVVSRDAVVRTAKTIYDATEPKFEDVDYFRGIAKYLASKCWLDKGEDAWEKFVVTPEGIDAVGGSEDDLKLFMEERGKTILEGQKLIFDSTKQLTTLSSGAIVILSTFLKDVFPYPEWPGLVGVTLISFLLCLLAAVYLIWRTPPQMIYAAAGQQSEPRIAFLNQRVTPEEWYHTRLRYRSHWMHRISLLWFFVGIASFVVFALKNLYSW